MFTSSKTVEKENSFQSMAFFFSFLNSDRHLWIVMNSGTPRPDSILTVGGQMLLTECETEVFRKHFKTAPMPANMIFDKLG